MISRVDVPSLKKSSGTNKCENCVYFSSTIMAAPDGWCGRYHSFQANTNAEMVCEEWRSKALLNKYQEIWDGTI